jgi:hypothetical protein
VYLDGGSKGTNTNSVVPSNFDRTQIGFAAGGTSALDGRLAEVAFWDIALSDAEVAMLALGYAPSLVRPDSLIHYWPLLSTTDPTPDFVGDSPLDHVGTLSDADHPRIIRHE